MAGVGVKAQFAVEIFKHAFIWSTAITLTKVEKSVQGQPEHDHEEPEADVDLTSIPLGFHQ